VRKVTGRGKGQLREAAGTPFGMDPSGLGKGDGGKKSPEGKGVDPQTKGGNADTKGNEAKGTPKDLWVPSDLKPKKSRRQER